MFIRLATGLKLETGGPAMSPSNYIDSSQLTRVSNIIGFDGQSGTDLYPLPNLCPLKNVLIPCCNNEKNSAYSGVYTLKEGHIAQLYKMVEESYGPHMQPGQYLSLNNKKIISFTRYETLKQKRYLFSHRH